MMPVCTFFGHRDCSEEIAPMLRSALINLIEHHGGDAFYVGNQGRFDQMVIHVLKELSKIYPHIKYNVVLAYMPSEKYRSDFIASHSILPDGIETVYPKFAISYRNRWMVDRADYVITYITRSFGGAARFADLANRKGKRIIDLG